MEWWSCRSDGLLTPANNITEQSEIIRARGHVPEYSIAIGTKW